MKRWKINRSQRKTALKMVRTIFDRVSPTESDANRLLMTCFQLAQRDLLDRGFLRWLRPPRRETVVWTGTAARRMAQRAETIPLAREPGDDELEEAFDSCEALCDRYNLDEDERDTLFTALPCVGLLACEELLEWKKKPPFPEVN